MKKQGIILLIIGFSFLPLLLRANNLRITSQPKLVTATAGESYYVSFGLAWDNSWKSTNPKNWDATWLFVKYSVGGGDWAHCYLDDDSTQHTANGAVDMEFECGRSRVAAMQNDLKTVGVFLRRKSVSHGNIEIPEVKLLWNYKAQGLAFDDPITVRVFALEMVLVNKGPFYLGTGGTETYGFRKANEVAPFRVKNENPIHLAQQNANNDSSLSNNANSWASLRYLPAEFPKGYQAFYIMKHELSQEAYVQFLNTLSVSQQENRLGTEGNLNTTYSVQATNVGTNAAFPYGVGAYLTTHRIGLMMYSMKGAAEFVCNLKNDGFIERNVNRSNDGQNVAMGMISMEDMLAYLDWAGLRPLTELEFEKAARGPQEPVTNEMVWGAGATSAVFCGNPQSTAIDNGEPTEEPDLPNANVNIANSLLRVGAFAKPGSTRADAGASYWGVLDLSGNAWERYINIQSNAADGFDGRHGDGTLVSTNGEATSELNWPRAGTGWIWRGSGVTEGNFAAYGLTSNRNYYAGNIHNRHWGHGMRGGRTYGDVDK